jgi:hypothetical protein
MSSQYLCSLYPKNSGSTLAEYCRMPTVPPRLTLFFILRRNDPHPTAVVPFLFFLTFDPLFVESLYPTHSL